MSQNLCSYVVDIRLTMSLGVALVGNHLMPHLLHRGKRRFFTTAGAQNSKLAGTAGAGRRWRRRLRSQTQSLTAQEANLREGEKGWGLACALASVAIISFALA